MSNGWWVWGQPHWLGEPAKELSKESIKTESASKTESAPKEDISDWRVWAKVPSGHCACNIPRAQCKYHS